MRKLKIPKFNTEEFLSKEQALSEAKRASHDYFNENEREKAEERVNKIYEKGFGSIGSE